MALMICAGPARANYASIIIDAATGRVLQETNADVTRYPASLTKMMTLYLLFEAIEKGVVTLDERLPISDHAASQPPSKLGLRPGQGISVENAILALVTKSANDVAAAVAEHLGGTESRFAWAMTAKAREIGMYQTSFANASGLPDPDQITTARDMAILGLALLKDYPQYYHYFSTDRFYYGGLVHANHNRLLGLYYGLDGIKTGYTASAGFNLAASAVRDGRRFIGVVLGARSPTDRGIIMTSLLDQAFGGGGEIIEVREQDPTPVPLPVQVASAFAGTVESVEDEPGASAVAAGAMPISRSVRSSMMARRAPFEGASQARREPPESIVKLARASDASARARQNARLTRERTNRLAARDAFDKTTVKARTLSGRQLAARSAPRAPVMLASARGPVSIAKTSPQLKMVKFNPRPAPTRLVKLSSAPDRSKLRVAEGGRKRAS